MRIKFPHVAAATLAVLTSVGVLVGASPALATPPSSSAGTVSVTPPASQATPNTSATNYSMTPPAGAACQNNADNGYNASTFIIPASHSPAEIVWTGGQAGIPGVTEGVGTLALSAGGGSPQFAVGLDPTTFAINFPSSWGTNGFRFANFTIGTLTDAHLNGAYKIGVACYGPTGTAGATETTRWWEQTITITFASGAGLGNFNWFVGLPSAAPSAPASVTAAQDAANHVHATWSAVTANPAVDSYDVSLWLGGSQVGLSQTISSGLAADFSGVANNTGYTVQVKAHNAFGGGAGSFGPVTSSASFNVTAGAQGQPVVSSTSPASGELDITWTVPGPLVPSGYNVVVTGPAPSSAPITGSPFNVATNHLHLGSPAAKLAAGTYTIVVTATYTDGSAVATPSAATPGVVNPDTVVLQDITVVRPQGALVLTQVCNSHSSLPIDPPSSGFPDGLPAVTALNESHIGAPSATGLAPTTIANGVRPGDSVGDFAQYPYPTDANGVPNPIYNTHCGIDLGKAKFVTRNNGFSGAGFFFAASGVMDEVTAIDTRDADVGWTLSGKMSDFTSGTNNFSGSQLGWIPKLSEDTGTFTDSRGNLYNQTVAAGGTVQPNSPEATGLTAGQTLLHANGEACTGGPSPTPTNCTGGLGTAIGDARLKLLIPVTANAGIYTGVLTLSLI